MKTISAYSKVLFRLFVEQRLLTVPSQNVIFFRAAHPDGGEPGTGLGRGILCSVCRAHQEPQMARQGDAFLLYFTLLSVLIENPGSALIGNGDPDHKNGNGPKLTNKPGFLSF